MKKKPHLRIALAFVAVTTIFGACERREPGNETGAETRETSGDTALQELEGDQQAGPLRQEDPIMARMKDELEEARRQLQVAVEDLEKQRAEQGQAVREVAGAGGQGFDGADSTAGAGGRALPAEETEAESEIVAHVAQPVGAEVLDQVLEEQDYQVFFVELARFGDWFRTDEYGYVWQPAEVGKDPSWRPYTRGRWLYSDQGWTWASDEPFGWAVYHYGRWALLQGRGWVWIPGDDWAPAWVSWRSNDDYLGWAPLPPETVYDDEYEYDSAIDASYDISPSWYSFVPVEHFHQPVASYCVPRETVVSIVIHTTNVTRVHTRNRRVYCGGPDYEWVNRRCGRRIVRCKLDLNDGLDYARGRHRQLPSSGRLEVFAPRVDSPWNPAVQPLEVARDWGRVEVVRGGKTMSRDVVNRFHLASVSRQEIARKALKSKEGHQALMRYQEVIQPSDGHHESEVTQQQEDKGKRPEAKKMANGEGRKPKGSHETVDASARIAHAKRETKVGGPVVKREEKVIASTELDPAKVEAPRQRSEEGTRVETEKRQREWQKKKDEALAMEERTKARRVAEERARGEVAKRLQAEAEAENEKQKAAERRSAMQYQENAIAKRETESGKAEAQKHAAEAKSRVESERRAEMESRKRLAEDAARKRAAEEEGRKRAAEAKGRVESERRAEMESRKRLAEDAARKRAEEEGRKRAAEAKGRAEERADSESRRLKKGAK